MIRPVGLLFAFVFVLGGVVVSGAVTTPTLVITDEDGSERLTVPVDDGSEVTVEYTHSVERTPVSDVYIVSDGALVSDRMYFSSYGAGLPSQAAVTRDGDRYVYEPPEKQFDPLVVSTGNIAGHELIVDEERYDLVEAAESGTVSIRVENRWRGT